MKITAEQTISSKSIAETFSEAAEQYHQKAEIQQKVATGLISSLLPWKDTLPAGDILEVGCGTGFLSEQIIKEFPDRKKLITDVAPGMISFCENQLAEKGLLNDSVTFKTLNVDVDCTRTVLNKQASKQVQNCLLYAHERNPASLD